MEVLAALPGIGSQKAKDCLDYYKNSAGRAIVELTCIHDKCFLPKGVAGGTVAKIRKELGLRDDERMWIEHILEGEDDGTE